MKTLLSVLTLGLCGLAASAGAHTPDDCPAPFDFNGDGVADLFQVGADTSTAEVRSGAAGGVLLYSLTTGSPDAHFSTSAAALLRPGATVPDLITGMLAGSDYPSGALACIDLTSGDTRWTISGDESCVIGAEVLTVADQDGDGICEVLSAASMNSGASAMLISGKGNLLAIRSGTLSGLAQYADLGGRLFARQDFDDSGQVDSSDIDTFFGYAASGDVRGDLTGDGLVDGDDFVSMVAAFQEGLTTVVAGTVPPGFQPLQQQQSVAAPPTDPGDCACDQNQPTTCAMTLTCGSPTPARPGQGASFPIQLKDASGNTLEWPNQPTGTWCAKVLNGPEGSTISVSPFGFLLVSSPVEGGVSFRVRFSYKGPNGEDCTVCAECGITFEYPCPSTCVQIDQCTPVRAINTSGELTALRCDGSPLPSPLDGGAYSWTVEDEAGGISPSVPTIWWNGGHAFFETTNQGTSAGHRVRVRVRYEDECGPVEAECLFSVSGDTDGDGLADVTEEWLRENDEACGCLSTTEADSDFDGFSDARDPFPCDQSRGADLIADSDNDGIPDFYERQEVAWLSNWAQNPRNPLDLPFPPPDRTPEGTNPFDFDTDGDGASDIAEITLGLDPLNPMSNPAEPGVLDGNTAHYRTRAGTGIFDEVAEQRGWSVTSLDQDGDGVADALEIENGLDAELPSNGPSAPPDDRIDSDHDGLSDHIERILHTDPNRADTDGDGQDDASEIRNGTSPSTPNPRPHQTAQCQSPMDLDGLPHLIVYTIPDEHAFSTNADYIVPIDPGRHALYFSHPEQWYYLEASFDEPDYVMWSGVIGGVSYDDGGGTYHHTTADCVYGIYNNYETPFCSDMANSGASCIPRSCFYNYYYYHNDCGPLPHNQYIARHSFRAEYRWHVPASGGTPTVTVDSDDDGELDSNSSGVRVAPDLDIDSDNRFGPGEVIAESDARENRPTGKLVLVDTADPERDGVPNFADWGPHDSPQMAQLRVRTTSASLRFRYRASPPSLVSDALAALPAGQQPTFAHFAERLGGGWRIWTKPLTSARNPLSVMEGGDFVPPSVPIPRTSLPEVLYVEAVGPSDCIGGEDIRVEDPDSRLGDSVSATAIRVDFHDLHYFNPQESAAEPDTLLFNTGISNAAIGNQVQGALADGASVCMVKLTPALEGKLALSLKLVGAHGEALPTRVLGGLRSVVTAGDSLPAIDRFPPKDGRYREDGWDTLTSFDRGFAYYVPPATYWDGYRQTAPQTLEGEPAKYAEPAVNGDAITTERFVRTEQSLINFRLILAGEPVGQAPFWIRRPPLILVHGIKGHGDLVDHAEPMRYWGAEAYNELNLRPIPTRIYKVDYKPTNTSGFAENFRLVPATIAYALEQYRTGNENTIFLYQGSPWPLEFEPRPHDSHRAINGIKYAATRADVVGHSMGGQLVRTYISTLDGYIPRAKLEYFASTVATCERNSLMDFTRGDNGEYRYLRADNLFCGDIRRFIPLASLFSGGNAEFFAKVIFNSDGKVVAGITKAVVSGYVPFYEELDDSSQHGPYPLMWYDLTRGSLAFALLGGLKPEDVTEWRGARPEGPDVLTHQGVPFTWGERNWPPTWTPADFPSGRKAVPWVPLGALKASTSASLQKWHQRLLGVATTSVLDDIRDVERDFGTTWVCPPTWPKMPQSDYFYGLPGGDYLEIVFGGAGLCLGDGAVPLDSAIHERSGGKPTHYVILTGHAHSPGRTGNKEVAIFGWDSTRYVFAPVNYSTEVSDLVGRILSATPTTNLNTDRTAFEGLGK